MEISPCLLEAEKGISLILLADDAGSKPKKEKPKKEAENGTLLILLADDAGSGI
jgi:hypothetical protein